MTEVNFLVSELSRADIFTPLSYLFQVSLLCLPLSFSTSLKNTMAQPQIKIWTLEKWLFEHLCGTRPVNNQAISLTY